MRQQSAFAPGRNIRATAEISHRDPTAREYSCIVRAQIGRQPGVHTLDSVPFEAVQVRLHGMDRVVASRRLNRLARDVDGNENPLLLEPFCRESVLVIGPLALWARLPRALA